MSDEEGPTPDESEFEGGGEPSNNSDDDMGSVEPESDGEPAKKKPAKGKGAVAAAATTKPAKGGKAAAAAAPKAATGKGTATKKAPAAAASSSKAAAAASSKPAAGAAAAAAAPAGGATKKITTEREAEEAILEYLNASNRPYSAQNVFDNLHGAIAKAMVPRLLDKLAAAGKIVCKPIGKSSIYWPEQGQYGTKSPAELEALKEEEKTRQIAAAAASATRRDIAQKVSALGNVLTLAELNKSLTGVQTKVDAANARLQKLQSSNSTLVDPAQRKAVVATLDRYRKAWAGRKAMVTEITGAMSEGMDKSPKAVAEMMGIETDEEAKINIKDY